jgi:hypothetical protein
MVYTIGVSQAPHASRANGGETATAREYFVRPSQRTPNGPRIASAVAGMAPGEFRSIYLDMSGRIRQVVPPDRATGAFNTLDWNPHAYWDADTAQLVWGGKRIMNKLAAYSDVVGDFRELPMPAALGRATGTGHWYGNTTDGGEPGKVFFARHRYDLRDESSVPTGNPPSSTGPASLTWVGDKLGQVSALRYQAWNPATSTWDTNVSGLAQGDHVLAAYHAAHDRILAVGGSSVGGKATLVQRDGTAVVVTSCPGDVHMSPAGWVIAHPSGCWLVRSGTTERLYAGWPNEALDDLSWEDLGATPDAALTFPTAAWDSDRELIYIVAVEGFYAYRPPELTNPLGVIAVTDASDVVSVVGVAGSSGSVSVTDAADVVSVVGLVPPVGSIAVVDAGDIVSVVGSVPIVGAVSVTDGPDVVAIAGVGPAPTAARGRKTIVARDDYVSVVDRIDTSTRSV